jgi:predicted outer membrane repeat protein
MNCTFSNNSADDEGGAIYCDSDTIMLVRNCILWGNTAKSGTQIYGDPAVSYSNIQGGLAGLGNTDANPSFVDQNGGEYHLLPSSPCINKGDPNYVLVEGETDIDGEPRVMSERIDMGADETSYESAVFWVSPKKFEFEAYENASNPQARIFSVRNSGWQPLCWRVNTDCDWLIIDPNQGSTMVEVDEVNLNVDIKGLIWGQHDCRIVISDPNAENSPQIIDVNLVIYGPLIDLSAEECEFHAYEGGINPAAKILTIGNNGGGTLSWEISHDCSWLEVTPGSGNCSMGETNQVTISVGIVGLHWGEYYCKLEVRDPHAENNPKNVDVDLVVYGPTIDLSANQLEFYAFEGGSNPSDQTIAISNGGGGTLNWEIEYDCNWLRVYPTSGSTSMGETAEVALKADISNLKAGAYGCDLIISDPNSENFRQMARVVLSIGGKAIAHVPSEYATIQSAIDAAVNGDTVIISPGTYTGPGNRDIDFKSKDITVRSIDPNDPNVVSATVIDCQKQGRGFYLNGCDGAAISGLTITNGYAETGGGIQCQESLVTIFNCRIISNETKKGEDDIGFPNPKKGTNGGNGGGICCISCEPTIRRCFISNNTTGTGGSPDYLWAGWYGGGNGGGVYCSNCLQITIQECVIRDNTTGAGSEGNGITHGGAGGNGAGIYCEGSCSLIIHNSTITENISGGGGKGYAGGSNGSAGSGGGICCSSSCSLVVYDSNVTNNRTGSGGQGNDYTSPFPGGGGKGAGIYCDESSSAELYGSEILNNVSGNAGNGGGVYCMSNSLPLKISNCLIKGNKAVVGGGSGGGIYCTSAVMKNTTVSDNSSGEGKDGTPSGGGHPGGSGGGIYCVGSLEILNCTIGSNRTGDGGDGNYGGGDGGNGGGVRANIVVAKYCLFSDNKGGNGGHAGTHSSGGSGGSGGAIYCTSATLNDCEVLYNYSGNAGASATSAPKPGGSGGGVFCTSGTFENCIISGNHTGHGSGGEMNSWGGDGGGIYCDSAMVGSCLIVGNVTGDAGGRWIWAGGSNGAGIHAGSVYITNSTIADNATGSSVIKERPRGAGGGVYSDKVSVVTNSIIWGNSPEQMFGYDCMNVSFCDIQDSNCPGLNGNISVDPLFIQTGYWANVKDQNIIVEPKDPNAVWVMGDYHLSQIAAGQMMNSPCVDAGSNSSTNIGLDKYTTRTDNVPDQGIVDMGYHYPISLPGDINHDGEVDFNDYALLAYQWQQTYIGDTIPILMGTAKVDANLSEWTDNVQWIALDKIYYGSPNDITEAKYALRWNPETKKIYAAVIVEDGDHIFSNEYIHWDSSDRIEIYTQGSTKGGTDWLQVYDVAQQYMIGPNTTGGCWATWAYGEPIDAGVGFEYAVAVDEKRIIYEFAVPQFDHYGGLAGTGTTTKDLMQGLVVGFDILASTRWGAAGFGMFAENLNTGKSGDASKFARYTLVEDLDNVSSTLLTADVDGSGTVDYLDLVILAENWLQGDGG